MRIIDADALIEFCAERWIPLNIDAVNMQPTVQPEYKLDEWCTDCNEYDHDKHCCPRFNRVIAEAIKEAKENTQPEQRWILVSERLPEESGWHICTCHDGVSERVTFLKWLKRLKQWEKTGTRSYWKVIAWMPLPEAYKSNNE